MRFETSDNLQTYIHEINKYAQLSKNEEYELGRKIQASIGEPIDKMVRGKLVKINPEPADMDSVHRLVQANLKFVITMANKFIGQNVPISDLINAGNIGMIEAAKRYDPDKFPVRFITYAARWLQKALNGEVDDHSKIVRIPKNQSYDLYKKRKAGEEVNTRTIELDKPISNDSDNSIGDILLRTDAEANIRMEEDDARFKVNVLMSVLTEDEAQVVKLRYGFTEDEALSNQEIADRLGMPIQQVGRTMRMARTKMRELKSQIIN